MPNAEYGAQSLAAETVRLAVTVERYRAALDKIDRRITHVGCNHCGSCIAHRALYGHWPTHMRRCCSAAQIDRYGASPPSTDRGE